MDTKLSEKSHQALRHAQLLGTADFATTSGNHRYWFGELGTAIQACAEAILELAGVNPSQGRERQKLIEDIQYTARRENPFGLFEVLNHPHIFSPRDLGSIVLEAAKGLKSHAQYVFLMVYWNFWLSQALLGIKQPTLPPPQQPGERKDTP